MRTVTRDRAARTLTGLAPLALVASIMCGGSSPPKVDWPAVAQCASIPKDDLFGSVQAVLLDRTTEPTIELERLAGLHGPHVIACLVDQAVKQFAAMAAAPQARLMAVDPSGAAPTVAELSGAEIAATRGRDFLQRVGTTVEGEAK